MSASTVHRSAPQVDPGPELRAVGFRLHYTPWAIAQAADAHARPGSVEAAGVIDPCDVAALDQAADDDALEIYCQDRDDVGPDPADWPAFTDRDVWSIDEPTAADRQWAAETADDNTLAFAIA
jgi:hypothetical protein